MGSFILLIGENDYTQDTILWERVDIMIKLQGKSVYRGVAMGPIIVLKKNDTEIRRTHVEDGEAEFARVKEAVEKSQAQLQKLYDKALKEVGEASAAIFEVHQMMLEDDDYLEAIEDMINSEGVNAEFAVATTGDNFADMFAQMDDEYMKARATDIKDISNRLVSNLLGNEEIDYSEVEPSIIVADDLTPSETVAMDKSKILAFVTVHGSANSHTSILARMMNIPAMISVPMNLNDLQNGMQCVVDAIDGEVVFEPTEMFRLDAQAKIEEQEEKRRLLLELKGKEDVTKSGQKVHLYANIGGVKDVAYVMENDATGIGLFRSEFLYLGRDSLPTEEEQYAAYKQVLQTMGSKKVVIRTLDIGADKQADYLNLGHEENPALGYRAIRICLSQPDIFKTQLRALWRASMSGNLAVMYPMITSTWEVKKIYELVAEVQKELDEAGIPYKVPEQGIMIETPASVMMSDELAQMVDFFSVGTNDLTQYTLAVDRQGTNPNMDKFYDAHHPAILKMLQMIVDNAHKYGKWAGICGELGADLELTETFLKMGFDELSVSPSAVLPLRAKIRSLD